MTVTPEGLEAWLMRRRQAIIMEVREIERLLDIRRPAEFVSTSEHAVNQDSGASFVTKT